MTGILTRTVVLAVKATEDLSGAKYKAITLAGTIAQANSGRTVAGIMEQSQGSGYHHSAVMTGVVKAYIGAAITSLGWPLSLANSGFLGPAAVGSMSVGRALQLCNSGDIAEVSIDVLNNGAAF